MRALLKSGGGRGLYAGLWGNLAGVAPASAIFMGVYEPVKRAVSDRVGEDRAWLAPLAGGVAAGLASSLVRVPTEVVKTRTQTREFAGAAAAVKAIVLGEGRRGLFAGYSSFLLRDLPFDAIEFLAYEQLKRVYHRAVLRQSRELSPPEVSVVGALAGAATGLLTTPLDVLKTRMMIDGARGRYAGVLDCAKQIVRQEGGRAFLRGWQPRVLWIGVGGSIFFTALETSKKLFAPRHEVETRLETVIERGAEALTPLTVVHEADDALIAGRKRKKGD